jgi:Ca-activated chloride channel homolog
MRHRQAVGGWSPATGGSSRPREVRVRADAGAGLARVVLEQVFVNSYAEPLHVTYLVPLPAEGAVAGYVVRVGDRRITGEVGPDRDGA